MPAPIVTVAEPVLSVRDLEADEQYVMTAFERHANHCYRCMNPLDVHQKGHSLCDRGHQYAIDVAAYLYSKNGKAYSVVDRDLNQPTLVKIPRNCVATRELLLAIEAGLRPQRREKPRAPVAPLVSDESTSPIISYDRTYHVPPRRTNTQQQQQQQQPVTCTEIIEREPRAIKSRRVIIYPSPNRGSSSRGSLYDSDAADRVERVKESSRIYRPTEYYR
ncbi:hypothetical protein P175DRAFT_0438600 [Aspergillus ochraceoroseus IBT 24754]|uniref:Uncharacterized protein n=3 Tax=Aspergillus subgen. Nidulantes TaxID=2720870 RepID=A0A0F8V7M7_9EURO|nr:uncharacterized protein P175DRAFT_0438600 [Aspergillus ochraceoroseus IBT 24754]KKK15997.1 hypothetical protein AOCH_007773 [Aspergillus ochraceoroseus]KKK18996.1 hypothetical protein ARAM_001491 [Aspergillus rambellii]PTU20061.1 hypothetical protein P175DRAFT_0438600 [Aspergillus ochraceoroseus IBT 24754]